MLGRDVDRRQDSFSVRKRRSRRQRDNVCVRKRRSRRHTVLVLERYVEEGSLVLGRDVERRHTVLELGRDVEEEDRQLQC